MSALGVFGAAAGLASTLYGAHKSAAEAKKQEGLLANRKAANEAWYNRNYYQDYLNTVQAQNALKQYRNAWAERTKEARARQAITGGTPEQAAAVAEAGGEAMGNMVGNLAAKGQQDRVAIDAQKLAMDNNLSQQQAAIAEARQQAASNLMSSGASLLGNSLQSFDGKLAGEKAASGEESSDIKVPETKNVDTSAATQTATAKPATTAAAPAFARSVISAIRTPKIGASSQPASPVITPSASGTPAASTTPVAAPATGATTTGKNNETYSTVVKLVGQPQKEINGITVGVDSTYGKYYIFPEGVRHGEGHAATLKLGKYKYFKVGNNDMIYLAE